MGNMVDVAVQDALVPLGILFSAAPRHQVEGHSLLSCRVRRLQVACRDDFGSQ